jgi:hypothetical protein
MMMVPKICSEDGVSIMALISIVWMAHKFMVKNPPQNKEALNVYRLIMSLPSYDFLIFVNFSFLDQGGSIYS